MCVCVRGVDCYTRQATTVTCTMSSPPKAVHLTGADCNIELHKKLAHMTLSGLLIVQVALCELNAALFAQSCTRTMKETCKSFLKVCQGY